jgi:hypothetical protein
MPFFFFGSTGSWTKGLMMLARQVALPTWATFSVLLCVLIIFWDRVWHYADWPELWSICASPQSWDDRHIPLHPVLVRDGVSWTFCPGWLWTMIFQISAPSS